MADQVHELSFLSAEGFMEMTGVQDHFHMNNQFCGSVDFEQSLLSLADESLGFNCLERSGSTLDVDLGFESTTCNMFSDIYNWNSNPPENYYKAVIRSKMGKNRDSGQADNCLPSKNKSLKGKCSDGDIVGGQQNEEISADCSDNANGRTESDRSGIYLGSKNLMSERKRRKTLNEKLLALRALVPIISKMDRTSIVADAISYVRSLQQQIKEAEAEISALQSKMSHNSNTIHRLISSNTVDPRELYNYKKGRTISPMNTAKQFFKILELNVTKVESKTFMIRTSCKKEEGVFIQLARTFESLQLDVINDSLITFDMHIINTVFAEVEKWEEIQENEIKEVILETALSYGLQHI